jgi:hypothetical protein
MYEESCRRYAARDAVRFANASTISMSASDKSRPIDVLAALMIASATDWSSSTTAAMS